MCTLLLVSEGGVELHLSPHKLKDKAGGEGELRRNSLVEVSYADVCGFLL